MEKFTKQQLVAMSALVGLVCVFLTAMSVHYVPNWVDQWKDDIRHEGYAQCAQDAVTDVMQLGYVSFPVQGSDGASGYLVLTPEVPQQNLTPEANGN